VRTAFGEQWLDPMTFGPERLGNLNARVARDYGFVAAIARAAAIDERRVRRKLLDANGRALVRNLFKDHWPGVSGSGSYGPLGQPRHREEEVFADRYQLTRYLGQGGYGEVWLVNDLTLAFPVSRVLKFGHDGNARALQREFQRADHLTHPNICKYVDVQPDEKSGEWFVVMVYGGEPLRSLLRKGGGIAVPTAVAWTRALAAALDFAHAQRIVHRDVSPANVVVDEREVVRLIDFGVADEIGAASAPNVGRRPTAAFTSTYGFNRVYGAPEIIAGRAAVPASDQYSLALVFCSMIGGRVFDERVPAYESPVLSRGANAAVRRALEASPRDRFSTCAAFAEALR
jgi:serine/threonine protein kinase